MRLSLCYRQVPTKQCLDSEDTVATKSMERLSALDDEIRMVEVVFQCSSRSAVALLLTCLAGWVRLCYGIPCWIRDGRFSPGRSSDFG